MRLLTQDILLMVTVISLANFFMADVARCCTTPSFSSPEIEIEVEFEGYDDVRDRVIYKIEVEAEVMAPTQLATCQCGVNLGSTNFQAPDSFSVINAVVGVSKDDGDDFDLEAFDGFEVDEGVSTQISTLRGFRPGGKSFGFSSAVEAFSLPPLQPEDAYVLGFLLEFDPDDFDRVNGNAIQFAAGSNEPGHPLNIFRNYQATLQLPRFQLNECDFNSDLACDVDDINALYRLGPIDRGFDRTDSTERYDLNGDDRISLLDLDEWLEKAADYNGFDSPYVFGDANLDGNFDSSDLVQVFQYSQYENGRRGQTWETGDWNGDELFDSSDLIRAFQTGRYEKQSDILAIPEPTTLLPVLLAFGWCVSWRRRTPV
ncbi:MAG: PEP-CTERM sorting domain-containing protein [Planctomycetales bacterium]|nr:PEP-CTERM sorting domain-containing protein [Planctomycetales bacterium]